MARIVFLLLIVGATIGALELGRWLVGKGYGLWALVGLLPVAAWVAELLAPGNQFGLGPLVEMPIDWALEGALVGFFVLPVMIGYAAGLVWGYVRARADDE